MPDLALLGHPIWHALATLQRRFAVVEGDAARFEREVTTLAGTRPGSDSAWSDLARLIDDGAPTGLFLDRGTAIPGSIEVIDGADLVQMIQPAPSVADDRGLLTLGESDVPEMRALAELTKPGPFGPRTWELGTFLGIRDHGTLAAMGGQRMRLPGLTEVSAICTHPEHLGRGHAARLVAAQCARIHAAGETPFLHVRGDNARAIALYERLGFSERRRFDYRVVRARRGS